MTCTGLSRETGLFGNYTRQEQEDGPERERQDLAISGVRFVEVLFLIFEYSGYGSKEPSLGARLSV